MEGSSAQTSSAVIRQNFYRRTAIRTDFIDRCNIRRFYSSQPFDDLRLDRRGTTVHLGNIFLTALSAYIQICFPGNDRHLLNDAIFSAQERTCSDRVAGRDLWIQYRRTSTGLPLVGGNVLVQHCGIAAVQVSVQLCPICHNQPSRSWILSS